MKFIGLKGEEDFLGIFNTLKSCDKVHNNRGKIYFPYDCYLNPIADMHQETHLFDFDNCLEFDLIEDFLTATFMDTHNYLIEDELER